MSKRLKPQVQNFTTHRITKQPVVMKCYSKYLNLKCVNLLQIGDKVFEHVNLISIVNYVKTKLIPKHSSQILGIYIYSAVVLSTY